MMKNRSYIKETQHDSRTDLKINSEKFVARVDELKGKLSYFNYDIGTGKTTIIAASIPKLSENNRVLIVCYSYEIVNMWYKDIKAPGIEDKIFLVSSPKNFNNLEDRHCPNIKASSKGLLKFHNTFCSQCDDKHPRCLYDWENKLCNNGHEFSIVITSAAFYNQHLRRMENFDVVIYDEIPNFSNRQCVSAKRIQEIRNNLSNAVFKSNVSLMTSCNLNNSYHLQ